MNKSLIVAVGALTLLGAAIGWRLMGQESDLPAAQAEVAEGSDLFARLEADAMADPDDPLKWQELGFALFSHGEFPRAAEAYEKALKADPDSAVLWSAFGEALVMSSETDPLPPEAIAAFEKAVSLDSTEPRARYFLAVKKDLAKDHEGAIADWLALLADTPPGAPWETNLVRTIQQVGAINSIAVEDRIEAASAARDLLPPEAMARGATSGPTQEQMAAAAAMSPSEQQNMAEGMVARLASRIEAEGGSVEEWIMLMRSYQQLGRTGDARRARDSALAAHPSAEAQISQAARTLQIR